MLLLAEALETAFYAANMVSSSAGLAWLCVPAAFWEVKVEANGLVAVRERHAADQVPGHPRASFDFAFSFAFLS